MTYEEMVSKDTGLEEVSMFNLPDIVGKGLGDEVMANTEGMQPETRATLATIARMAPDTISALSAPLKMGYDKAKQMTTVPSNFGQSGTTLLKGMKGFNLKNETKAKTMGKAGATDLEIVASTNTLPWYDAKGKRIYVQSSPNSLDAFNFNMAKAGPKVDPKTGLYPESGGASASDVYGEGFKDLANIKDNTVDLSRSYRENTASYSPDSKTVTMSLYENPKKARRMGIHEGDHMVQHSYGLQGGSSLERAHKLQGGYDNKTMPFTNSFKDKLDNLATNSPRDVLINTYKHAPGEVLSKIAEIQAYKPGSTLAEIMQMPVMKKYDWDNILHEPNFAEKMGK